MGQLLEDPEIGLDLGLNAGAADLQHHSRSVLELGPVHLGDGGSGIGFAFQVNKDLERRAAERLLDLRPERVKGDRRHLAVQGSELRGPRRGQEVLARREHLAKFDEGRPEFLARASDALGRLKMGDLARLTPVQDLTGAFEQGGNAGAPHHIAEPVPDQN